jgi:hypothetical protein
LDAIAESGAVSKNCCPPRGTKGSNPSPSTGESAANLTSSIRRQSRSVVFLKSLLQTRLPRSWLEPVLAERVEFAASSQSLCVGDAIGNIMGGIRCSRGTRVPIHMIAELLVPSRGRAHVLRAVPDNAR